MPAARPSRSVIENAIAAFRAAYGDVQTSLTVTRDGDIRIEPIATKPQPNDKGGPRQWGQA